MSMVRRYLDRAALLGAVGLLAAWGAGSWAPGEGLFGPTLARAQSPYPGGGDAQNIPLEELLNGNRPLSGAVHTRGILEAGPRNPGGPRRYSLMMASDRLAATTLSRLQITPGAMIRQSFDFDADSLNMREIEVTGTFAPGSMGTPGSGFWFWSYSAVETGGESGREGRALATPSGLLAIEDLVGRPARLAKETVRVRGQFRGKNLFGDLAAAGAPVDGWVIKDGDSAVWVSGKRPKGNGWSLDPDSRSDTNRWVEVTGKIETRDGVTLLRAGQVALVPPPKPDSDSQ
jgi:hypothetical protein